jgi:hypothetical protein
MAADANHWKTSVQSQADTFISKLFECKIMIKGTATRRKKKSARLIFSDRDLPWIHVEASVHIQ